MTAVAPPERFEQTPEPPRIPADEIEANYRMWKRLGEYTLGDRAALTVLHDRLADVAPPEALQELVARVIDLLVKCGGEATVRHLLKTLQRPVLSDAPLDLLPMLAQPSINRLAKLGDDAALTAYCRPMLDRAAAGFIAAVNDRSSPAPRIVFVADQINYKVLREALYLRRRGVRTFLIGLTAYPPEVEEAHALAFEARLALSNNMLMLEMLLDQLAPDIYHVHCNMHRYMQGRVVIERKRAAKVVCEFNDIGSVYADRAAMCAEWTTATVDGDCAMETFILHNADGFVHQWRPSIEPVLAALHGAMPPAIEFQPYPCTEFMVENTEKLSKQDGVIRFVYAGNPCPVAHNTPGALFPGRYLPDTAEALCRQGFAVDVFQDPSKFHFFHDPEGRYARAKQSFPQFRMLKGVPPMEVPRLISQYDFGLMALKLDMSVSRITPAKWRNEMANKFFAYLEAGLPLLVSSELQYMAELVEEWGIGIAASADELDSVGARVRALDYAQAVANVKRFNEAHMMDRQIDRLIALYERITQPAA